MAIRNLLRSPMDATPQNPAPVMQVVSHPCFKKILMDYMGVVDYFCLFIHLILIYAVFRIFPPLPVPEPSTSRASLNFQDVLSRPPLNRSHLHFPSHDGSPALGGSLFSQPSTSTAPFPASPFAVSSSFSLVKEIKDSSSQHEDDNISTTSGFSSRASDKGKAEFQEAL